LVPYKHPGSSYSDNCGRVSPWRRPLAWLLQQCGVAVRVHEILRSDSGRDFHDHPWNYVTLVLSGGYTEVTPNEDGTSDYRWCGPGTLMFRRAEQMHRLLVDPDTPAVTLFITGRWLQPWGFYTETGKVHHKEYLARAHLRNQDVP